jgi:hypothetical protein
MDMSDDVNGNAQESEDPATQGQCTHCSACQICHSVAMMAILPRLGTLVQPHSLRPTGGVQFASASMAPRLKPPIL